MGISAKMSIGNPINAIPDVKRKRTNKTRLQTVLDAVKKAERGVVLPVYTSSKYAASGLAHLLRKSKTVEKIAVRKHIVYVQVPGERVVKETNEGAAPELENQTTVSGI